MVVADSVASARGSGAGFDGLIVDVTGGDEGLLTFAAGGEGGRFAPVAVVISGRDLSPAERAELEAGGVAEIFPRTVRVRAIAARLRAAAAVPAAAPTVSPETGSLADRSLLELLTDVEIAAGSGTLQLVSGDVAGTVGFVNGALVSASVGNLTGPWALAVLSIPEDGTWALGKTAPTGEANLAGPIGAKLDAALADAQRLRDAASGLPALEAKLVADTDRIAEVESSLSDGEWRIVQAAMGANTLLGAVCAVGGDPLSTLPSLRVLDARGIFGGASRDSAERARAELARAQELARNAAEEANRAEEEARRLRIEHDRIRAEEDARRRVEEEARMRAAEEARRRAEEARRVAEAIAEEEERRAADEVRRRAEEELAVLQAEMDAIEADRHRELQAAEAESERIRRAADEAAAALRLQAETRASEFEQKQRDLRARRVTLTGTLTAIGTGSHRAVEPFDSERRALAAERVEALSPPSERPPAVEAAVQREMAALRLEQSAGNTGLLEATGAATLAMHAPTSAAPADPAGLGDDFFSGEPQAESDLFAEPEQSAPNATRWAAIAVLLFVVVLLFVLFRPAPEPATQAPVPAPTTEQAATPAAPSEPVPDPAAVQAAATEAAARIAEQQRIDAEISGQLRGENVVEQAELLSAEASGEGAPVVAVVAPTEPREPRAPREPREPEDEPVTTPEPRGGRDAERALNRCANTYSDGNYAETLAICGEAVAANPRGAEALLYLGRAHYELGDSAEAVRFLERAFQIDSRGQNVLLALGAARQDVGDNDGARVVYERFLELHAESRRAPEVRSILESL